jgi:hypothetical protein
MRMFVLMYSGPSPKRVEEILERHDVHSWTSYGGGHGSGRTGRHEGTRAWPGESTIVMSVVPAANADAIAAALEQEADALPPGERLHLAVMPIERFF